MNRPGIVLLVGLAVAGLAFVVAGGLRGPELPPETSGRDITWLRTEFGLNDEQFAAVRRLHDEYAGVCAQHCADIAAARAELARLGGSDADPAVREAAVRRVLELEAVCNESTRAHLRRVAAAMPAAQGERFLAMIEPHLAQLPHDGTRAISR